MKIHKLTLDDADQKQAVQAFLATKGITLPVNSIRKPYSWSELEVTFKFEVEPEPPAIPAPEPVDAVAVESVKEAA